MVWSTADIGAYKQATAGGGDIVRTLIPETNPAFPGDYSLMSTAAAEQLDLVGLEQSFILECYAGEITEGVTWVGWVTDPTHNITIKAAEGEGHGGAIGGGFILRGSSNQLVQVLAISVNYVDLIDFTVEIFGTKLFRFIA